MSNSVRPQRRQPTRLPHPWDSPGKNTGVGCHFLLQCMKVKSESEGAQSCPTLCNSMDCSTPGLPVHQQFPELTQTHVHCGEGNGAPLQYSCLENPMDGGAWWAAVHGVVKSRTRLNDFTFMHWRRKWEPTQVFLPGESQGRGSPVGCHLWGHTESDTTEVT